MIIIPHQLRLVLSAQDCGYLIGTGCVYKMPQSLEIDSRQLIDQNSTMAFAGSVYHLEQLSHQHCQCSSIDRLPLRIIAHADDFRVVRIIYLKREIIPRKSPVQSL